MLLLLSVIFADMLNCKPIFGYHINTKKLYSKTTVYYITSASVLAKSNKITKNKVKNRYLT